MLTLVFKHYPLFASAVGSRPPLGAVSVFWRRRQLITNVYIDGFNLYYRALKDTPFRWLDLHKLAETLFRRRHHPQSLLLHGPALAGR